MKKIKILIILLLIVSLISISKITFGFSNDIFSIDVPESFSFSGKHDDGSTYKFKKDDFLIIITTTPYVGETHDITYEMCEDLIEDAKSLYKNNFNATLINDSIKLSTVGKEHYKCRIIQYDIKNYNSYIKEYIVTSDNYVYIINLSSNNKADFMKDETLNILNSFTIKDTIGEKDNDTINDVSKDINDLVANCISTMIFIAIIIIAIKLQDKFKERKNKAIKNEIKETKNNSEVNNASLINQDIENKENKNEEAKK